ncbi:MAG: MoaD/ThiS family protein, partial [Halobacteria archaeon]|nr:MoaD/ThiS family protein [Halobacteria archaeon]
ANRYRARFLRAKRFDEDGDLCGVIDLYVNGEDVRHKEGLDTSIDEDDEVSILPAVSGGTDGD